MAESTSIQSVGFTDETVLLEKFSDGSFYNLELGLGLLRIEKLDDSDFAIFIQGGGEIYIKVHPQTRNVMLKLRGQDSSQVSY